MNQKVQYDAGLAAQYTSAARFSHPMSRMQYDTWLETLGDIKGMKILDLACGSGYCSRLLAERGATVIGVDISSDMIALAKAEETRQPMGIEYFVGNAATFDLREQFDIVTPTYLLHYAESAEELAAYAKGIARHLKIGGRMVALHASDDPVVPRLSNAQHSSEWVVPPLSDEQRDGLQIRLRLYDIDGKPACKPIVYRYWSKETYCSKLLSARLADLEWIKIEMPEEAKRVLQNWKELDRLNASCVLTATKI